MYSCPKNAITIANDEYGFRHPRISQTKCIDCGLCVKTCPSINPPTLFEPSKTYAAKARDEAELKDSASGGIASILSKKIILAGGIVYGCDGKDINQVRHVRSSSILECKVFKGSKYLQSDLAEVYQKIKNDLESGLRVLLIALPCQIAGIRKFLKKDYVNFFSANIICHGASSQQMVSENVNYYLEKYHVKILSNVRFRRKAINVSNREIEYGFYFDANSKSHSFSGVKDMFTLGYCSNLLFRESCYHCPFAKKERPGDITIGDFWKLKEDAQIDRRLGVSVVICNTNKGLQLLNSVKKEIEIQERTFEEAAFGNPQLLHPTAPPKDFQLFRTLYCKKGLIGAIKSIHQKTILLNKLKDCLSAVGLLLVYRWIKANVISR